MSHLRVSRYMTGCLSTICLLIISQGSLSLCLATPSPESAQRLGLSLIRHKASALAQGEATGVQLSWGPSAPGAHLNIWSAWGSSSLSNQSWGLSHDEYRLHPQLDLSHPLGRATLSLSAGLGALLIHERRARHQAERLGLTGQRAQTSASRWGPELSVGGSIALALSSHFELLLRGYALYRPAPLSSEGPALTFAQSLGLCWRYE